MLTPTEYRVIDRRKHLRGEDAALTASIEARPFEVQSRDRGSYTTIPGAWYASKAEALASIKKGKKP